MLAALAGFLLAADGHIPITPLLATVVGTALIIASACVFNNIIDRDIDAAMERTRKRALATGSIAPGMAAIYGTALGLIGSLALILGTNALTLLIGLIGWIDYVVFYTYSKRKTVHSTLIGSISGAVPPVAGYTAVTNSLDVTALLLFAILVFWQMVHFYGIALYRQKDYAAANLPVLPVARSVEVTKRLSLIYLLLFIASSMLLYSSGSVGITYLVIMIIASVIWIRAALTGYRSTKSALWGKKVFLVSLLVICAFSVSLMLNFILP